MNLKKNLSLIVILVFSFVISLALISKNAKSELYNAIDQYGNPVVVDSEDTGMGNEGEKEKEPDRSSDFYQVDSQTDAYGGTSTTYVAGPDVGMGETFNGWSYSNPTTGAQVSYSQTGFGMGQVAAPIYGGVNSMLGAASYGPLTQGIPQTQSTYGYNTQSSMAGNAFGQGYQYQSSVADPVAQLGMSLIQNPSTMGAGIALMYNGALASSSYGGNYGGYAAGLGSYGGYSGLGIGGYGYTPQAAYGGSYGGYAPQAAYGGSYGGYAPQAAYGGSYGYSQPAAYGSSYGYAQPASYGYSQPASYGSYGYAQQPSAYSGYGSYGGYPVYGNYLY